jgi:hypothetical protein
MNKAWSLTAKDDLAQFAIDNILCISKKSKSFYSRSLRVPRSGEAGTRWGVH